MDGTKINNASAVDPTLPLQQCTKDTLPPPPTSANFLNRNAISAMPNSCECEEKNKEDETFSTEDALSQAVNNFNNVLTRDSVRVSIKYFLENYVVEI